MAQGVKAGGEKRYHMSRTEADKVNEIIKSNIQPWPEDNKWWQYTNGYSDERVWSEAQKYINPRITPQQVIDARKAVRGHLWTSRLRTAEARAKQKQNMARAAQARAEQANNSAKVNGDAAFDRVIQTLGNINNKLSTLEVVVSNRLQVFEQTLAERSTKVNATLNHLDAEIQKLKLGKLGNVVERR